jgi:potassium efflux system protein
MARQAALRAEIEMLRQERLSLPARTELLAAKSEWLTRKVANLNAEIETLSETEQRLLRSDAEQVGSLVESAIGAIPPEDTEARDLVAGVDDLAKDYDRLVNQYGRITAEQTRANNKLQNLNEESEAFAREFDLGGTGATMAQTAFDLQDRLLGPQVYAPSSDASLPSSEELRLRWIAIKQALRDRQSVEAEFSNLDSAAIDQLLQTRRELLEKLDAQYKRIIPSAIALEGTLKQIGTRNREVRRQISEALVWIRSSPPLSWRDAVSLPVSLAWLFSVDHWREFCGAVAEGFARTPLRIASVLLLVVLLMITRLRMIRSLEDTGDRTRRISTDRYMWSWEALLWTILLAAPLPILLALLGWSLGETNAPSSWMRGLADGIPATSLVVFMLTFAHELSRPGGLGSGHFGWDQSILNGVRGNLFLFGIIYVPCILIVHSTLYGDASHYADSVGRFSIMFAMAWTFYLLWRQFGGSDGLVARLKETQPNRLLTRTRILWYPLMLIAPIVFLVLAARGYVIAAIEFSEGFAQTLGLVLVGEVTYWMVLRWFSLQARTLAVSERLERILAAREGSGEQQADDKDGGMEAIDIAEREEYHFDLERIGKQTKRLIRSLISLGFAVVILYYWSRSFPLSETLSDITVPLTDGTDLLEVLRATVLLTITWVMVRNIPGVLELSVLSDSSIDSGTRYAITALCRYAIAAIGGAAVFNALNFDWTKFGWMAAALGVGLGFGLQEVITNFVCGLILLFERPVRLGDVVTIQGVTGTVTRIRMRATTITNWDRQEFVVPNKSLITDTILNWTLSASVSRIVVNVGVAYGSDTELARQILLDVASSHDNVMAEPAPMATFEQFADSTLNLVLRCYVPDLDYRLRTISELHTEINRRFAEAGIEIAFPQQDIHIRSGLEALKTRRSPATKRRVKN